MRDTHFLYAGAVALIVAIILIALWVVVDAAPQNNAKSQTVIANESYNDTYGAEQVTILAQVATSPSTTNAKSMTVIANESYNATYGAKQVVLSTSTGKQVPFTNLSGAVDGDLLKYDTTGSEWINTEGEMTITDANRLVLKQENVSATPTFSFGDGDTGLYQSADGRITVSTNGLKRFEFNLGVFGGVTAGVAVLWDTTGSATTPVIYFSGDSNTGIWHPAADQVAVTTGGTNRLTITSTMVTQTGGQGINRTDAGAADYNPSALTSDFLITANNSAAARAITISTEDVQSGSTGNPRIFLVKDEYGNAAAQNLTVSLESGNIDGAASQTISADYGTIQMYCDGTNCFTF